jgi:hypothetical protein
VSQAVVDCLLDHGVPAEVVVPPVLIEGDGDAAALLATVAVLETGDDVDLLHARCRAGLDLPQPPPPEPPSRESYESLAAVALCLIDLGDEEMIPPPSFEVWAAADPDTRWSPWVPRRGGMPPGSEACFGDAG